MSLKIVSSNLVLDCGRNSFGKHSDFLLSTLFLQNASWKEEILSLLMNMEMFISCNERFSSLVSVKISVKYANFCNHVVHVKQFDRWVGCWTKKAELT
jgi:CRISPR-associated protein Cas8b1/Cst1 subtype I-B